jgi:hypothetical protein
MSIKAWSWAGVAAAALPPALVTVVMLSVIAEQVETSDVRAAAVYRNSAEAAAAGDAARALRFLRMGHNPTRIQPVRPHLISPDVLQVTTLEAAMWSRQIDLIRALDREGAIVDPDQRRDLACLAFDLDLLDAQRYLAADVTCERGAAIKRIIERSAGSRE